MAYLSHLAPSKESYDKLYRSTVQDGRGLVEIFSKPPLDPLNPVSKLSDHLRDVEDGKKRVDAMWAESWGRGQDGSSCGESTPPSDEATPNEEPGPVGVVSTQVRTVQVAKVKGTGNKNTSEMEISDRFSELEEEAYEVKGVALDWGMGGRGRWVQCSLRGQAS